MTITEAEANEVTYVPGRPFIVVSGNRDTIEQRLAEAFVRGYTPKLMSSDGDEAVRIIRVLCEHADVRNGAF